MANTDLDVAHVAKLARLNLTEEETELYRAQLQQVLAHADKLREVEVEGIEVATHTVPLFDVFREDAPRPWFTAAKALANAPRQAGDLFIVPKVVE